MFRWIMVYEKELVRNLPEALWRPTRIFKVPVSSPIVSANSFVICPIFRIQSTANLVQIAAWSTCGSGRPVKAT